MSDNKKKYQEEREKRWVMAKNGEEPAIKEICSKLSSILQIDNEKIIATRYDQIWFEKYDLEDDPWVKGCPDYVLKIQLDTERFCYVEIKLKAIEFQLTEIGGKTQKGSVITKYGCTSYYLDIEPVYTNIMEFSQKNNIDKFSIWIAFVKDDLSEIKLISLSNLKNIIENGWNGTELCQFSEGYGKKTYLIPKDATKDISTLDRTMIINATIDRFITPQ